MSAQTWPSPEKPMLQKHSKEPCVLLQKAFLSQLLTDPDAGSHSLISKQDCPVPMKPVWHSHVYPKSRSLQAALKSQLLSAESSHSFVILAQFSSLGGHAHSYEPGRLTQIRGGPQVCVPMIHSFTSKHMFGKNPL